MLECCFHRKSSPRRSVRIHRSQYLSFSEIFHQLQTGLIFLWSTSNRSTSAREIARGRHTSWGLHPMRQLPCRTESRDMRPTRVLGHLSAMLLGQSTCHPTRRPSHCCFHSQPRHRRSMTHTTIPGCRKTTETPKMELPTRWLRSMTTNKWMLNPQTVASWDHSQSIDPLQDRTTWSDTRRKPDRLRMPLCWTALAA